MFPSPYLQAPAYALPYAPMMRPKTKYIRKRLPYRVKKSLKQFKRMRSRLYKAKSYVRAQHPRGSAGSKGLYGEDWSAATDLQKANRRAYNFRGKGEYFLPGESASRGPLNYSGADDQNQISVNKISDGIVITHTEFVQNIVATTGSGQTSSAFQNSSFSLNPGLSNVFPFLAQIAENFTTCEWTGLMFQYKPTSGEFGSTTSNALGKVIMCTNYDPSAAAFTTSQEMENYSGAASCKPSCGLIHGVECEPSRRATNELYVRTGATSRDLIFTDLGLFQFATEGIVMPASSSAVVGELWVTYSIKLREPKLALGSSIDCGAYNWSATSTNLVSTVPQQVALSNMAYYCGIIANANILAVPNINNVTAFPATTSFVIALPATISSGAYRFVIHLLGQSGNATQAVSTIHNALVNGTTVSMYFSTGISSWSSMSTAAAGTAPTGFAPLASTAVASGAIICSFDVKFSAPQSSSRAAIAVVLNAALSSTTTVYVNCSEISSSIH